MPANTSQPTILVVGAPGINRDEATKVAIEMAGGHAEIIPVMTLRQEKIKLDLFQAVVIPGGFSYGDHIQSGRVLSSELKAFFSDELNTHIHTRHRPVLGVCNGFQVLVQMGLLPFGKMISLDQIPATLTTNEPSQFQSRWVNLYSHSSQCLFIPADQLVTFPVAHGEGRFITDERTYDQLEKNRQIVFSYCDKQGKTSEEYPLNPNGSPRGIAGICDDTGLVFGMMPHAEDYLRKEHHPNWRRLENQHEPDGLAFFRNLVHFIS